MTRPDGEPDSAFPAEPYPGAWPAWSFVHEAATAARLVPDRASLAGWRVGETDVDSWLAARGAAPLAERVPVLAYGSNRCPSKITWLRRALGLPGPAVVLHARTADVGAVWAVGRRMRDGQRPAVLAHRPGAAEEHAVWLATRAQLAVLDRCEGRTAGRYRLARLRTGRVVTEDGTAIDGVWCYLGLAAGRRPLLVDGRPVACAEVGQGAAAQLRGVPAGGDGLRAEPADRLAHPDDWPATLFVYGLLQPGQPSWQLLADAATGPPQRATVDGTVLDTGRGYPGLVRAPGPGAPGWVVPVAPSVLARLDVYEGPAYRRVRLATRSGTACWAYLWDAPTRGLRVLPGGWPPAPAAAGPNPAG